MTKPMTKISFSDLEQVTGGLGENVRQMYHGADKLAAQGELVPLAATAGIVGSGQDAWRRLYEAGNE